MKLLIVTDVNDVHADSAVRLARDVKFDIEVVRFHPSVMAENLDYSFVYGRHSQQERCRARLLDSARDFADANVVWWRKPDRPRAHPGAIEDLAQMCSRMEYKELLDSLAGLLPSAVWINNFWRMQEYQTKLSQLRVATKNGFLIPETIVTRTAAEVRDFSRRHHEVIFKPFLFPGFEVNGIGYSCWTNAVTREVIDSLTDDDLALAPMLIQERIRKSEELRVTVFGEDVFACAIDTSHEALEGIDWRIVDVEKLPHRLVRLPEEISRGARGIIRDMGLNFGALDIIRDAANNYYFLEVNPNGQWLWIEELTGAPMTESLLRLARQLAK